MSAVKVERMTKYSKARKIAKRRLPKLLREHNRRQHEAFKKAKRPRPPRLLQRQWRLAAKEAARKAAEKQRSKLAEFFGIKPEAA